MAPRQSLDKTHLDMALPEKTHIEQIESIENFEDDSIESLDVSWFVWLVAITASIAGGLFGYDTGIISAILVSLGTSLDGRVTTSNEKELITSLCSGGAFGGCITAGLTADKFGRKGAIYAACVLFFAGSILQATSYSIAQMAVGRVVVGFGVGSASAVVPMYLAEIAPTKVRGRLMGLNNMSITGGQVISYGIGAAFNHVTHGWRYMAGLGALPPIILVCLLPFCPESPRQLIYHNKLEEAEIVIRNIYKGASELQIRNKVALINQSCELSKEINESETRWAKIKRLHQGSNFRALLVACGLAFIAQMSGFNTSVIEQMLSLKSLMYYSSTLFALVGFSNPVAVGLVVAGTNFVMTWVNMMVVDPFGRRRLLVYTVWGMSAGLVAVAVAFSFIPIDHKTLELENATITPPAIVVLVFIIWFVFFYGVSVGNTAWMSTDFFPMDVRAMGTMWSSCSTWAANIVVSSTFLSMMKTFTPSGAFGFYAGICFFGWILIIFCYPEVSGLTLEEVQDVFSHGFGVKYASKLRKERKLAAQQPGNEKI
ncbi:myo-inositol transporter [Aureobasidium subglaciale]|nr:myo-inositol transporter [Aureobasidium subglaciale]